VDGQDGNATCGVCHDNSENVETKILQWGASTHAIGGNFERNGTNCAPCHTSQGFKEVVQTGEQETAADIMDPANINCYTCHKIHDTYAVEDWELRAYSSFNLWLTGDLIDMGSANLCARCHQPRTSYAIPDVNNPDGSYEVTSSRFGPHHGPQSTVVNGLAFYMVGSGYSNSSHADIANGCVHCHMGDAYGNQAGGHTFSMDYEYHGELAVWAASCIECHGSDDELHELVEEWEAEFDALATELGALLFKEGIITESGSTVDSTFTNRVAGACWNWRTLVIEDRSKGIHNPRFAKKILENSIESLQ
jgi:formate-dependent nitrite reductase cytochrome c552 subunit